MYCDEPGFSSTGQEFIDELERKYRRLRLLAEEVARRRSALAEQQWNRADRRLLRPGCASD
jgi:hypothetical protein